MRRWIGLAAVVWGFWAVPAPACQCGEVPSLAVAFPRSELVFAGTVTGRWPVLVPMPDDDWPVQGHAMRVLRTWKGSPGREVFLADMVGNCSYPLRPGETYLVFASRGESYPYTTICDPTAPFDRAAGLLRELGPGTAVQEPAPVRGESAGRRSLRIAAASGLTAVALVKFHWKEQLSTVAGLWLSLAAGGGMVLALVFGWRSLRRRGWRFLLCGAAAVCAALAAGLFLLGYLYAAGQPGFRSLVE